MQRRWNCSSSGRGRSVSGMQVESLHAARANARAVLRSCGHRSRRRYRAALRSLRQTARIHRLGSRPVALGAGASATASSMVAAAQMTATRCSARSRPSPRCRRRHAARPLRLLIEGCEESGSFDLPFYVEALRSASARRAGRLSRCRVRQLRSALDHDVSARSVARRAQRRGVDGRSAFGRRRRHRAIQLPILRNLMNRIEDPLTGRLHDALYVDVPPSAVEQLQRRRAGARHYSRRPLPLGRHDAS